MLRLNSILFAIVLAVTFNSTHAMAGATAEPEASPKNNEDNNANPADFIRKSKLKCGQGSVKVAVWKHGEWAVVCS